MDPIDQDEQMQELLKKYEKKKANTLESRKKPAAQIKETKKQNEEMMDVENKKQSKMKIQDLPEDVDLYLIDIYPFGNKLFLTGIMRNRQTLNVVANQLYKEIYFVLKNQGSDSNMSEKYLQRAEQQIRMRLKTAGLTQDQYDGQMVDMQYVFEIGDIPRDTRKYFKVRYSFKFNLSQQIEPDWQGETFKYVIGTSYTALELLIINKRVKGPCWIRINKSLLSENKNNNAEVGLCVDMKFPQQIEVLPEQEPPIVRVLSFSLKSIVPATLSKKKYFSKDKDDTHIYAISYHYCDDYKVSIKDQKPKLIHQTFYLEQLGKPPSEEYRPCQDEKILIAKFQAVINKYDPDFIVCHDSSATLDTLICRISKLDSNSKIKLSRLRLAKDVSKTNQNQRINTFLAGRLLVDTFFHAKDMVKCIQYTLDNLVEYARPGKKFYRFSDEQQKQFFNQEKPLLIVNKCKQESELTFDLMNHFQILQMTRQLSNICGNLWKKSLENKRAERNQFLIMHECKKRNLVIPDKFRKDKSGLDDEQGEGKKKYQGGMVLEPQKGFYSDYILLLDFNSLYPSLIRQYNVCFSIIDRPKLTLDFYYKSKNKKKEKKEKKEKTSMEQENPEDDGLEEMFANVKSCPDRKQWGFLPRLIDEIVEQRKICKKKMKKSKNPVEYFILQIQQKCYKVVANSIYGCLGFSISRFYSRPLAALITKKGRDSLMKARDIVQKRGGVKVIYGDTDSLMIQPLDLQVQQNVSEAQKLKAIKKIADQIKAEVNGNYKSLQIDIDGIFKPLILLMKKKYVANKLTNFQEILIGASTEPKFSLQFKGIQIVRRDGCKISRDILEKVINIMVRAGNCELDTRYLDIIELFTTLQQEISDIKKYPLQSFQFAKQLGKKPSQYANAQHLPHVKVASDRIAAGQKVESLLNHTIFYVICKPRDETCNMLSKNAYDLKTFKRTNQFEQVPLQIDYDYYKSIIVEPVGRLLANINDQIYDQIVSVLKISRQRVKNIKQAITSEFEVQHSLVGTIGNNLKNKCKQLSNQIGQQVKCLTKGCNSQITLINEGAYLNTFCSKCNQSIINQIYNKIWMKIKQMEVKYYNNRKRCHCQKAYELTPILPCCQIDKRSANQKHEVSFKLHNFLYLVKDICSISEAMMKKQSKHMTQQKYSTKKIEQMVDNFLQESAYEEITSTLSKLKL